MSLFRICGKGWLGEVTLWSIQLVAESRFSELVSTALRSKTVKGRVVSSAHFYLPSIKYTSVCSFTSLLHSYYCESEYLSDYLQIIGPISNFSFSKPSIQPVKQIIVLSP